MRVCHYYSGSSASAPERELTFQRLREFVSKMTERPYQPGDLPDVIETYRASIHALAAPYYTPAQLAAWAPEVQDEDKWRERLSELHTLVAQRDGAFAGFASYTLEGYLDFLFVRPAFARRGVATGLCRCVEAAVRAAGAASITTHASLAARAFFDRQGFEVDCEEFSPCRGEFLRRFAMHKDLDTAKAENHP
jgi:putative acetyltransferase